MRILLVCFRRRYHAVMGHLSAFFLLDVFDTALNEISAVSPDPTTLLAELKAQDDSDYRMLMASETPEYFKKLFDTDLEKVNITLYGRGENFCHTARLPAEIRHKGILTESNLKGFATYDKGIGRRDADSTDNDSDFMRLVYDEEERADCPVTTIMDYKDYYYLHEKEIWKKLILPNDSELKEYGHAGQKLEGMILMCYKVCDWGQCPPGAMKSEDLETGKFKMSVNNVPVTKLIKSKECELLTNREGVLFKPNAEGRFEIMAKVFEPSSYLRISSFIIW